ncbi:MAG TPA: glycosyltransferase family 4 protein [Patescibacteria group bacterium]|nr:glycosyltransferase family 4 protein [Patescibacteria group bacterium]
MKILYWTETFWPHIGGVEVLSRQFIPAMQKRGYDFTVITSHTNPGHPDETRYGDIPVHRFHFRSALASRNLKQLRSALENAAKLKKALKPDLVHINTCYPSVFFHLRTMHTHRAPTLLAVHELPAGCLKENAVFAHMVSEADWVVAVSQAMLQGVRRLAPDIAERSSLINNALDSPDIAPLPLPFKPARLLCVGRLIKAKGFDLALEALALLKSSFPCLRLIIAGDGLARQDLESRLTALGIQDMVEFIGWVSPDRICDVMNTATAVIVPSRWQEPFGLVALEAAHMARPVVAARVGGLPEIVIDGETGLLFDKEDSAGLAGAITFLLEHPHTAQKMGEEARKRVRNLFNWKELVNSYDTLYKKLIQKGSHAA